MVAAAAREIRDGEVVFAGMRLPLIAFALAKEAHAPNAIGLFECGLVRATPSPELLCTMGDPDDQYHGLAPAGLRGYGLYRRRRGRPVWKSEHVVPGRPAPTADQ